MKEKSYRISGKVINAATNSGLPGLYVEAWDKDLILDDLVGSAVTDETGKFFMEFNNSYFSELFLDRRPDLYFKIFFNEIEIHSTKDNIIWNYDNVDKEIVIEIDFAATLPIEIEEDKYIVSGYVRNTEYVPVPGVNIEAFDKKIGKSTLLGKEETNDEGYYQIDYTDKATEIFANQSADIYIKGSRSEWNKDFKSDLIVNASNKLDIDLTIPVEFFRSPSEFEKVQEELNDFIEGDVLAFDEEDIEYLTAKLTVEVDKIKRYIHSHRLQSEANQYIQNHSLTLEIFYGLISDGEFPNVVVLSGQTRTNLKYALEKAIGSNIISENHRENVDVYVDVIKEIAVEIANKDATDPGVYSVKNVINTINIPAKLKTQFIKNYTLNEENMDIFWQTIEQDKLLGKHIKSFRDVFALSEITKQNVTLIKCLREDIKNKDLKEIGAIHDLAKKSSNNWKQYIIDNNIELPIKNEKEGQYTVVRYSEELAHTFKTTYPMVDFSDHLKKNDALPKDKTLQKQIIRFSDKNPSFKMDDVPIERYLAETRQTEEYNDSDLKAELQHWQRVYKLLPEGTKRNELAIVLKHMQLEETNEQVATIIQFINDMDKFSPAVQQDNISARRIASMNKKDFIRRWETVRKERGAKNIEEISTEAEVIYNRAKNVNFIMTTAAMNNAAPLDSVKPAFTTPMYVPPLPTNESDSANPDLDSYFTNSMANLRTLFGNQDYCECQHCESIISPAAYLVELWKSLSPKSKLFLIVSFFGSRTHLRIMPRRPDILLLSLNCKNTETVLPYIDLVNELLERFVVYDRLEQRLDNLTLDYLQELIPIYARQTTYTENELALRPEHEFRQAYLVLAKESFPLSIPWDKWFEEARLYLEYMGIPLYQLIQVFTPMQLSSDGDRFDCKQRKLGQLKSISITQAMLGMTDSTVLLITANNSNGLRSIFGISDLEQAKILPEFMRQLGFWKDVKKEGTDEQDFLLATEILGSRYIQESNTSSPISISFSDNPCDFDKAKLININIDTLVRVAIFERLRRILGWSPIELHHAMMTYNKYYQNDNSIVFQNNYFEMDLLYFISNLIRLRNNKNNIPIIELLSWWGPMDTGAWMTKVAPEYKTDIKNEKTVSLYEQIFLNKSLYSTHGKNAEEHSEWNYFLLNEDKTELANQSGDTLLKHSELISAALGLTHEELSELVQFMARQYSGQVDRGMTFRNLCALFRTVSLARYLGLSLADLYLAYELISIDPFQGTYHGLPLETETTVLFVESVRKVQHSPFSFRELAYLWRHQVRSYKELETYSENIKSFMERLIDKIVKIEKTNLATDFINEENVSELISNILEQLGLNKTTIDKIITIIDVGSLSNEDAEVYFDKALRFLSISKRKDLVGMLVVNRPVPLTDEHYSKIINYLERPLIFCQMLANELAVFFGTSELLVKKLLSIVLDSGVTERVVDDDVAVSGLEPISTLGNVSSGTGSASASATESTKSSVLVDFTDGDFVGFHPTPPIRSHVERIGKIVEIASAWKLTANEIEYLYNHQSDYHEFDWNNIPIDSTANNKPTYEQWAAIADYVEVRNKLSINKGDIIQLFNTASASDIVSKRYLQLKKQLAVHLNVTDKEVSCIFNRLGYVVEDPDGSNKRFIPFSNGESLKPIIKLASIIKRSGRSCTELSNWVSAPYLDTGNALTLDAAFPNDNESDLSHDLLRYKVAVVDQIRNAVKAQCNEQQWQKVAREYQDRMRILQRDKLLDYITSRARPKLESHSYYYMSQEDVYDFLLIDPHMNPCMNTTRLKQVISSLQLYIHRLLMGLEKGIELLESLSGDDISEDLKTEWKWKKSYRLWEAHMKVFLYPENWLEPELRDNKTPFFKEFESELSQSDIEEKTIEKAFKNYLAKVDEVGNLEVAAFKEKGEELHVIGRTREKPCTHYYRKRDSTGVWLPWERIDLDIESNVVLLTIYNGLPYIFWPIVKEKIQKLGQDNPNDKNNDKNNYRPVFEIRFNWSSYNSHRWTPKKKSDTPAVLLYDWKYQEIFPNLEEIIKYEVRANEQFIRIDLSIISNYPPLPIEKYTWSEDKLSEIFENIKALPSVTDWKPIMHDWAVDATHTFNRSHIKVIDDAVNHIASWAGESLKYSLHSHKNTPFASAKSVIGEFELNEKYQDYIWLGILGWYIDGLPSQYPRNKGFGWGYGIWGSDESRINNTLRALRNINESSIELNNYCYRCLRIDNDRFSDNRLITFSQLHFSGYKLNSKTKNWLGLEWVKYADSPTHAVPFGSSETFSKRSYTFPPYQLYDNTANDNYHFKFEHINNLIAVEYTKSNSLFKLKYNNVDLNLFKTKESKAVITTERDMSFRRFIYQDKDNCYYLEHSPKSSIEEQRKYNVETFFHPFVKKYNYIINNNHLDNHFERYDNLFQLNEQNSVADFPYTIDGDYIISQDSISELRRRTCFDINRPYGSYNWEIFFHLPLTVAVRLSQNKKYREAQQWFHYIFNPLATVSLDDGEQRDDASKYWNCLPLHNEGRPKSLHDFEEETEWNAQLDALSKDPYQPHVIARKRKGAYQKTVVMKYLDNLIDWADYLFEQDSIESINEATHLYVLASKILGPRPKIVPKEIGVFSTQDANLLLEDLVGTTSTGPKGETVHHYYYSSEFCIPNNDNLLAYWDTVADRLFKVRNCRNIEGVTRELPIFEPPIDPGLLVRGQALGVDISDLLSDLFAPLPPYRFKVMLQKAYEFCADVRNLGGALLAALEKKDAEALSLLRTSHEKRMLKLTRQIKKQQIKELRANLKATQTSLEMAEGRFEYYDSRPYENQNEKMQVSKLNTANDYQVASQAVSLAASIAYLFPQMHAGFGPPTIEQGGKNVGDSLMGVSKFLSLIASVYSHGANMHSIQGGRERRMDDWNFQAAQSTKEIKQIKRQILASEIRINIAEKELANHEKQEDHAEEIETFMQSKFTNKELYHWMISQVSTIYFQTYKMAVELAKTSQRCYRHEKGDDSISFINASHWDNLKKGLLSGEQLQFDLRRMENNYLQNNKRELELTKNISLNLLAPMQLDRLRYEGECEFTVPELLFDLDYPGQYQRRIKSVSVSIPCVVGPHTIMGCRLSLSTTSTKQLDGTQTPDPMSSIVQSISLSSGQNDSGLFELNHNDERYLPFELRGVNGNWCAEFLSDYPSFDHSTISDLILHVRYTALEDSTGDLRNDVNRTIAETYNVATEAAPEAMGQRLDIRRDFPDAWHSFQSTGNLTIPVSKALFPYLVQPVIDRVKGISILAEATEGQLSDFDMGTFNLSSPQEIGDVFLYRHGPSNFSISMNPMTDPVPELELSVDADVAGTITELIVVLF